MNLFWTVVIVSIIFVVWCGIFLYCTSQANKSMHEEFDKRMEEWRRRK